MLSVIPLLLRSEESHNEYYNAYSHGRTKSIAAHQANSEKTRLREGVMINSVPLCIEKGT